MLAGIKDFLIVVNKGQLSQFKKVLPEKNNLGIKIQYKEQSKPRGFTRRIFNRRKIYRQRKCCFDFGR